VYPAVQRQSSAASLKKYDDELPWHAVHVLLATAASTVE